jgi:transcriptional regulator with GAF, ATPase, and Fis domain
MPASWHYFFRGAGASLRDAMIRALSDAGIRASPLKSEDRVGGGILFFDRANPDLCNFIRRESRHGLRRILAAALPGVVLGEAAWQILESGASDVFAWDQSPNPAAEVISRFERWDFIDGIVETPLVRDNLVGRSPKWLAVLRRVVEAASFTDAPVLITGESGTGKELVARLIHTLDRRPHKRDLVVLDCSTIVRELSGSEFFGHERGAFTGAVSARDGVFALADKGTLFLDEVGELPVVLQAELLRVVQEHTYKRVGGNTWQESLFRLVCATNRDLRQEEALGQFRRDFYYRIAGCICELPPLRERPEDILPLTEHFLSKFRPDERPRIEDAVRDYLMQRSYPGNVRDLKQLITRISYRHAGTGPITAGDIPPEDRPQCSLETPHQWRDGAFELAIRRAVNLGAGLKEISQAATDTAIRIVTEDESGNLRRTAKRLGITDRALQMRRAAQRDRGTGGEAEAVCSS